MFFMSKIKINCKICGKEFYDYEYRKREYCSKECYWSNINNILGNKETRKCKNCGKEFIIQPAREKEFCSIKCSTSYRWENVEYRKRMSEVHKGERPHRKGIKINVKHNKQFKKGMIPWNKGLGNSNPYERHKKSIEHKNWRSAIFERDNYTCQICRKRGGKLNADHIKPYALYPELRLDIDNGRTLCEECHRKTDTYGGRILKLKKLCKIL